MQKTGKNITVNTKKIGSNTVLSKLPNILLLND